jgi:hypothetical protein
MHHMMRAAAAALWLLCFRKASFVSAVRAVAFLSRKLDRQEEELRQARVRCAHTPHDVC